ncbi:hypothetical protein MERGE_001764 [Pneumocystis wakefieldiae]|uniref:Tetrapyrrole biosynthesis uroporphyrinogen III synthase domain-containing protein n=1 Tax=Pneumocystis wakefieldiae TaxID=38082 RepID=A0A899FUX3_9ASCO|nr:hypothetical protein MERGE_001764 [Pneumocystis wakefieldiae]
MASPGDNYEQTFKRYNFYTIFLPVLTCSYINQDDLIQLLQSSPYNTYSGLIFTSRNAILAFRESILSIDKEEYQKILSMTVYTVGPSCHREAISLGFSEVYGKESGNAEDLSNFIISYHKNKNPVLFLGGERRMDTLRKRLSSSCITLRELAIYKMNEVIGFENNFSKIIYNKGLNIDWIVFFSPYGSDIVMKYIKNEDLSKFKIATIGFTTSRHLNDKWNIKTNVMSQSPQAISLLKGILDYEENTIEG